MEPHRAKYQDEGVCRQDCITDQDCHGAFRCTKDGVCLDLEQSVGARQYTPAYEPDPVSLREAFESDKLLNCREFIGCYIGCNGDSRTCRLECEVQTEPAARSQVGQILHCVQNICESPEASEIGYVDCLRGSCPAVLEACGIP